MSSNQVSHRLEWGQNGFGKTILIFLWLQRSSKKFHNCRHPLLCLRALTNWWVRWRRQFLWRTWVRWSKMPFVRCDELVCWSPSAATRQRTSKTISSRAICSFPRRKRAFSAMSFQRQPSSADLILTNLSTATIWPEVLLAGGSYLHVAGHVAARIDRHFAWELWTRCSGLGRHFLQWPAKQRGCWPSIFMLLTTACACQNGTFIFFCICIAVFLLLRL